MAKSKPCQKRGGRDDFQTPPWAARPLRKYIQDDWTIWEAACGAGFLVEEMLSWGNPVWCSDIDNYWEGCDYKINFLDVLDHPLVPGKRNVDMDFDVMVTNPPYSLKNQFIATAYARCPRFALLMPFEALATEERQYWFKIYGLELLIPPMRINFILLEGRTSSAWQSSAWFTHGLDIGKELTFLDYNDFK